MSPFSIIVISTEATITKTLHPPTIHATKAHVHPPETSVAGIVTSVTAAHHHGTTARQ
ncbi:hypothetical protein CARN8_7020005 [mine drainage metagenome]|uniref:Uncharacterized protein n=1 Tax=mine drainage metagenome TaxID=410659 RepID=A0A3P3ZRF6_9ZZZZ